MHGVTKLVIFSFKSSKFDSAGELTALPSPLAVRRGEGLPPLFKLLGFQASEPPSTFCRITLHEAVLCGVPNDNMTANDTRAYQTTSFV